VSIPISAIVLTKNEEKNLPGCLASLTWADEIVVVDSLSNDGTVSIASHAGVRVVEHPFTNFAAQHNFAQNQARHDWVLFVDADERVSDELREEICWLSQSETLAEVNAYHIQRVHLFSGTWFPDPTRRRVTPRLRAQIRRLEVPRLYDRRLGIWERALHEVVIVPEPHGVLDGVIYHYAASNLSLALADLNFFTDLEAAYLEGQGKRASVPEAIARGTRAFVLYYFVWGWCRYGWQGLVRAMVTSFIKFVNYAKLNERYRIRTAQGVWTDRDRDLLTSFNVNHLS